MAASSLPRVPVDALVFRVVVFVRVADLVIQVVEQVLLGLHPRVLLLLVDVFQAELPQLDVAPKEDEVEDATDGRTEQFLDHQEPVEQAVGEHGRKQAGQQVSGALLGLELRQREEIAHHHAEQEMPRHGEQGPDDARADAASQRLGGRAEDVHDVLDTGESEADERGIDDAVHVFVEVLVAPNENHENEELGKLFGDASFPKSTIENAVGHPKSVDETDDEHVQRDG